MQTWLKQQGKSYLFSHYDKDLAYDALQELGVLHMNAEVEKPQAAKEEDVNWLDE